VIYVYVLIEHRLVTDRQGHRPMASTMHAASRGKNCSRHKYVYISKAGFEYSHLLRCVIILISGHSLESVAYLQMCIVICK